MKFHQMFLINLNFNPLRLLKTPCIVFAPVGGADDNACSPLNSVERYDSNLRKWASVAGMHKSRTYLSSVVRDGKIYVAGGSEGENVLNSVER